MLDRGYDQVVWVEVGPTPISSVLIIKGKFGLKDTQVRWPLK